MDLFELKREQSKFAKRVELQDNFSKIKTIGGVDCAQLKNKLVAAVVVCEYPSMILLDLLRLDIKIPLLIYGTN